MPSLFGWLERFPGLGSLFDFNPAVGAAVLRALRAAASTIIAILLTAAAQGVLFPTTWSPIVVIALTAILQAVDKYLRDIQDAAKA